MRRRKVEGRLAGEFSKARNKEAPQAGPQLNLVSSPFQKPGSGGARAAAQIYHRTEQRQIPRRDVYEEWNDHADADLQKLYILVQPRNDQQAVQASDASFLLLP